MFGRKARLERIRKRATEAIIREAAAVVPGAGGWSHGAIHIDPRLLAIWITTQTDAERDRLAGDRALTARFREILAREGYPAAAVAEVGFAFESQETVDRVHGGNWRYAVQ